MILTQRFWDKVEKTPTCWNWLAAKSKNKYGWRVYGDAMTIAHDEFDAAWESGKPERERQKREEDERIYGVKQPGS